MKIDILQHAETQIQNLFNIFQKEIKYLLHIQNLKFIFYLGEVSIDDKLRKARLSWFGYV